MARSGKRGSYLLLVVAMLVGGAGSWIRLQALAHSPLQSAHSITFTATVETDPVLGKEKVVGSRIKQASTTFLAVLHQGRIDGLQYSLHLPVRITSTKQVHFLPGSKITGSGSVLATSERRVAALISARSTLQQTEKTDPLNRLAGTIRATFRKSARSIGGTSGALIPGLVLGDTSLESTEFQLDMRRSGLTHLTAVSGENFAIIASFLLWALQFVLRKLPTRIVITALVLLAFIFLVRPSPSVLRASVMTSVLLLGKARGVRTSALPALGLAISGLILIDPFQAIDPGFALSVSATAGILILAPSLTNFLSRFTRHEKVIELLAIPMAATVFCTPLIIAISGQFSLIALPANFLVAEVVAPITVIGFIAALLSPVWAGASHLLLLICKPFSAWVVLIAHRCGALPVLQVPKSFTGAALTLVITLLLARRAFKSLTVLVVLAVTIHLFGVIGWPGKSWVIVNCDVGQGDGAVINLGAGSGLVIDTGPDPDLMDKCLSSLRIRDVPLLVLTHFHADHVNGLSGVMRNRHIGAVWISNNPQPTLEYEQTISLLRGKQISIVTQGEATQFQSSKGLVKILALWPTTETLNLPSLPGDGSGINNSSIALLVNISGITFFTSGDTEPPAQEEIVRSGLLSALGPVTVMKVSHHGSAYQYLPLVDALKPRIALISVGVGNSYGHPAPSTIAALENRGIAVYRTDRDGAIAVDADLKISTQRKKWWDISWG
jgi:competence protein ComEC